MTSIFLKGGIDGERYDEKTKNKSTPLLLIFEEMKPTNQNSNIYKRQYNAADIVVTKFSKEPFSRCVLQC
jgi:hypothetical protein